MKRRLCSLALTAALAASVAPAWAQPDQGRVLFNAGAQAYEAGQFPAAIQAFEEAYRISARPGILFSIAQAQRKQFYVSRSLEALNAALMGYRAYLQQVSEGGRRSDAAEAIAELEPLAAKLGAAAPGPIAAPAATRLMVSSQTAGAQVVLDGGKPLEAPLIAEVKAGKHALRLSAPGYFDEARDIEVAAGSVSALDIPLKEKPGRVTIKTSVSAQVSIDGRFLAQTPLAQPLDVEPGRHLLIVATNGYGVYSHEIDVARDEPKTIDVTLVRTGQRTASFVLMGLGVGAVIGGGVLAALAVHQQTLAQQFDTQRQSTSAPPVTCTGTAKPVCPSLDAYNSAQSARDELRRDAGIVLAAAALVGGAGVVLFAFDQPNLGALPTRRDETRRPAPGPTRGRPMEMSAAPVILPGFYGAALSGRF